MLSVNCFSVLEKFQCSRGKNLEIYSFVVVENSDRRVSIPLDTVKEKCMAISTTDKFFLTSLLCMTEHDYAHWLKEHESLFVNVFNCGTMLN